MRESPRRVPLDRVVETFLADCRARRLSPRTLEHCAGSITSYRRSLAPHVGTPQTLSDLDLEQARRWSESLADRRSPASIGNAIAGLKVFSRWLVTEGHLRTHPLARLRKPRSEPPLILPLSRPQALALLGAARRDMRLLLMLLLDSGLRTSESTSLAVRDVNDGFVHVRHAKGRRERLVPYEREVDLKMRRYLTRDRPRPVRTPDEPVFLNRQGGVLRPEVVRRSMKGLGVALGMEGVRVSPHTLRHTFAR
ncbi:MAG: tyrosine-type recombinase/integrase [Chloroflexi bacterium]|nr:tyrosine-type recombinase/integrase [Chloroflexota bacterium]